MAATTPPAHPDAPLGVVVPLLVEARCFGPSLRSEQASRCGASLVRVSGMGPQRAALAAEQLADDGCRLLVSFGTAGALVPELESGDLLLTSDIRASESPCAFSVTAASALLSAIAGGLRQHSTTRCLTDASLTASEDVVEGAEARQALAGRTGAVAVDLESLAIAGVASRRGLPFLAVRCIVDTVGCPLPAGIDRQVDAFGRPRWTIALWALARPATTLPALLALGPRMARARHSLGLCAGILSRPLPTDP